MVEAILALLLSATSVSAWWWDEGENREARLGAWIFGMLVGTVLIALAIFFIARHQRRDTLITYATDRPPPPPGVLGYDVSTQR